MARAFSAKVLTANALIEGDVVYLDAGGRWTRDLSKAALLIDEKDAEARLAQAAAQSGLVVGPYLAEAQAAPGGPAPVHFREDFRRKGPSNYAHGKQVELKDV